MSENENVIYCYIRSKSINGDVVVEAFACDGHVLTGHISSNVEFAKHDIGITSTWKHDIYNNHFPDGWVLEWVDDPMNHPGWLEALRINKEQFETDDESR